MDTKGLTVLSGICSFLQIAGFALLIALVCGVAPSFMWVLYGVSGFAAMVKVFLPLKGHQSPLAIISSLSGVGIIIISCAFVAEAIG